MLARILLCFILTTTLLHFSTCESDSEPSDATSRIRFVQYQPATVTVIPLSNSDNTVLPKEQESRRSEYFENSIKSPLVHQQEQSSEQENHSQTVTHHVPKNYAFSYAIRDRNSGDDFSHSQAHNGEATKGEYRVKLPDGRVQIVTYTADNGGYRADIRYDKGETQPIKQSDTNVANQPNSFTRDKSPSPYLAPNSLANQQQPMSDKKDSALLYFNEIRTFDPPTRANVGSYETVEHVDEEPYPYSKKLLADVNYLLKYVTPTLETQTENIFDITPDHKVFQNRRLVPQNAKSSEQQNVHLQQKIPYKLLKLEDLKFDHPILNSPKYDKSKFDSLPMITTLPLKLNLTARVDPSHLFIPQYSLHRETIKPVLSHETGHLPQLITPKYILKLENVQPPQSNQESLERPTLSKPSYQQTIDSPHEVRGLQFVRGRYEPKAAPPSTQAGYEPQNPSTVRDQPSLSTPSFRTQMQATSSPHTPSHNRYNQQNYDSSLRYIPQRFELPKQDKPVLELPTHSGERYNQIEVSVYHAPGFEQYNLKNPQFSPSPSPPRQSFLTPTSQNSIYNAQRYVSNELTASPQPHFKAEDFPTIPQSPKQTPQPEERPPYFPPARDLPPAGDLPPVSPAPDYNSQEYPPVSPAPKYNPKDFPPVTAAPIRYNSHELNEGNLPVTPLFRPTPPTINEDRRPNGEGHFGKIEIPQYLHIHRYEDSGENAKPKELIYYTPLHITVPNSVAYMEQGSQNATGSFTPSYVTMTEHPALQNGRDSNNFYNQQPDHEGPPHPVTLEGPPPVPSFRSMENMQKNKEGTTQYDKHGESSPWQPSSPAPPLAHADHSHEVEPERYEKPMSDFDARIYSGYFDFIPTGDTESVAKPVAEESHEVPQSLQQSSEMTSLSGSEQGSPLPQYYYDFSTATPIHRYISAEVDSHETNVLPEEDQIRNSSFRSSAYLRPLRKERVYIHHNALPTTTTADRFAGKDRPTKPYKSADVSIVKSISSTIPPELLKDFDQQLRSSTFRRDNSKSGNDLRETKVLPPTLNPKLKELIAKKLQATIPNAGKVYLKTDTQQKRIVR